MHKTFPLSKNELEILQQHNQRVHAAQGDLNAVIAIMLARHDLPNPTVVSVTDIGITVDVADAPVTASAPPIPTKRRRHGGIR